LQTNRSIKTLDLHCNCVDDEAALVLAQALRHNKTLQKLVLTGNRVTDEVRQLEGGYWPSQG
jgi:Ran GTPase-activating protein (RanGAP) involved in mRNA processing and transport